MEELKNISIDEFSTSFDLSAYINRYPVGSEARVQRLRFLAEKDPDLFHQALPLLESHFRETNNVVGYKEVFRNLDNYDDAWVQETENLTCMTLETLEARLSAAQSQLQKEAIRTAYLALGDFWRQRGDLSAALQAIMRSREYCTSRAQTAQICLLIIDLAMSMKNYTQVHEYVAKAEHSTVAGDVSFPLKLKVAAGTAFLAQGSFYDASQQFGFVYSEGQDLGLPPEDIALYGALCSMAFSKRSKLQTLVDSPGYLDLVPALQEALQLYCRAHLPSSFKTLKHYYPALERDMILAPKLKELFECIKQRFCMDYLKPYRRVDLNQMAALFEIPVDSLIVIVADLIGSGKITASRIDWTNRILERLSTESILYRRQQATQKKLKYMEQNILNNAYGLMVRVACMENAPDQAFNAMDYSDDDSTDHLNSRASGRNPEDF